MNPFLPLPLPLPQTYAPWPVWSDSTTAPIRFQPMPKKAAVSSGTAPATSTAARTSLAGMAARSALARSYPLQERAKRQGSWDFCGKRSELLACK